METLTHWKKEYNYDYIGAYSLPPDGSDIILTIKDTRKEKVVGGDGKKQDCFVVYFAENVKPMILNRTNAKTIQKVYNTPYIEQWQGKQIQLYATKVNAFGSETDALRIRDFKPNVKTLDVTEAKAKLNEATTLEALQTAYKALSKEEQFSKEVIALVNSLKATLANDKA